MSRLTDLVSKVFPRSESTKRASSSTPTFRSPEPSTERSQGQQGQASTSTWLSHFAEVAPDHIKRWTNANDGSGNISYEQLVQNLKHFNIPARHVSEFNVSELFEAASPKQMQGEAAVQEASASKESPMQSYTEVVPVCSVTRSFVGPVANTVGTISGVSCKPLKRPGPNSAVPVDFIEVIGSKRVQPLAPTPCVANRRRSSSSSLCALKEAKAPMREDTAFHKPPPIFLKPVVAASRQSSLSNGDKAAEAFMANIRVRTPSAISPEAVTTKEAQELLEASQKPVVYTMGRYVWSEKEAAFGSACPSDPPPIDKYFGKICEELFFNKTKEAAVEESACEETSAQSAPREGGLFVPEVVHLARGRKAKLEDFVEPPAAAVQVHGDSDSCQDGAGRGLRSSRALKKGQVVFAEFPFLSGEWSPQGMWQAFTNLDEKSNAALNALPASPEDLSKDEALLCLMQARAGNRLHEAKAFKLFYAKVKRHAHCLPLTAGWSLYARATKLAHSCAPNLTFRKVENNLLVFIATRDIEEGEGLTLARVHQLYASRLYRAKLLEERGEGPCQCSRCTSGVETERRILCPRCRPTKLRIVDEEAKKTETAASAKSESALEEEGTAQLVDSKAKEDLSSGDEEGGLWSAEVSASASESFAESKSDLSSPPDVSETEDAPAGSAGNSEGEDKPLRLQLSMKALTKANSFTTCVPSSEEDALVPSSEEDALVPSSEDEAALLLSGGLSSEEDLLKQVPRNYCQREASGVWLCGTCGGKFADEALPLGMESYFERLYEQLQSRFASPNAAEWSVEAASLIRSVQVVLGVEHWLYAATNLLLSQLYLGQWEGGVVRECIFDRSLQHAEVFLDFVERSVPEALHVDAAPLAASLMRVLLFNGRWKTFASWGEDKKRVLSVRLAFGDWDEATLAFERALVYVQHCQRQQELPQLSELHRFAHTSQFALVKAAEALEEQTQRERAEQEERERRREETRRREQARLAELKERNEKLRARVERLKAEAAAAAAYCKKDVTASHPESVLGKFMLEGVNPLLLQDAAAALQSEHRRVCKMQEDFLNGRHLCPGFLAAECAYLPPEGVMPSKYLPLILLDDPLRTLPEKSRDARRRRLQMLREKELARRGADAQDFDFEEDESEAGEGDEEESALSYGPGVERERSAGEEKTMVFRIPGLSGTAPGEFVNVTQLVHDKRGRHPTLPFFRSFFYIDSEERRRGQAAEKEGEGSIRVLGSSQTPPELSQEQLADLENAKFNYLHEERKAFETDVRNGLLLSAAEAGALESGGQEIDVLAASNKVIQSLVLAQVRAERSLMEARREMKGLPPGNADSFKNPHTETALGAEGKSVSEDVQAKTSPTQESASAAVAELLSEETCPDKEAAPFKTTETWVETLPPENSEGGPTVFLFADKNQTPANSSQALPGALAASSVLLQDAKESAIAHRFLKPLDFSAVPPPPIPPSVFRAPIGGHRHYKLGKMHSVPFRLTRSPQE